MKKILGVDQYDVRSLRAALAKANERNAEQQSELDTLRRLLELASRPARKKEFDAADFQCIIHMRGQGVSQRGIARALGVSGAVVSLFLRRKYQTPAARQAWEEYDRRRSLQQAREGV